MFDRRSFLRSIGAGAAAAPLVMNPVLGMDLRRHSAEVDRELRAARFDRDDDGLIYLPRMKAKLGGYFKHWVETLRDGIGGAAIAPNLVVDTGLNQIMQNGLSGLTGYVGIFKTDVEPAHDLVSATLEATVDESIAYSGGARKGWAKDAYSAFTYANAATPAQFVMTAAETINGALLGTNATREAGTGTLIAAANLGGGRILGIGDKLNIEYGITLAAAT